MACTSCQKNINNIQQEKAVEWLSQEEVKDICYPCYENMVKNNITRIKRSFLASKVADANKDGKPMKFYEIMYIPPEKNLTFEKLEKMSFNLAGRSLKPYEAMYLLKEELVISEETMKQIPHLRVIIIEANERPSTLEAKKASAKARGFPGVMWVGASHRRVNEHGDFTKNVVRFDLSHDIVRKLVDDSSSGFIKVD